MAPLSPKLMQQRVNRAIDHFGRSVKMTPLPRSEAEFGSTVMRWFRDNIRRGSWFALVALAINIGLSFGHIHAIDGKGLQHRLASQIAAIAPSDDAQTPGSHDSDPADLLCPICVATSAIAHALNSAPPALPLALAEAPIDLTIEHVFGLPQWSRSAFYARGPPIS
jgi:hypothetical protein